MTRVTLLIGARVETFPAPVPGWNVYRRLATLPSGAYICATITPVHTHRCARAMNNGKRSRPCGCGVEAAYRALLELEPEPPP